MIMKSSDNETLILLLTLLITSAMLGGGYWWFKNQGSIQQSITQNNPINVNNNTNNNQSQSQTPPQPQFSYPENVASGTNIRIDGSTSLAHINKVLKTSFEQKFPNTLVTINAKGSDHGIQSLLAGKIDIAAISRPLTPQEMQQGLQAIPVANDAIAVVVDKKNPYQRGLTQQQVREVFTGGISNWQELGKQNGSIRVINRPEVSGTRQIFQKLVLNNQNFGNGANFQTLDRDATTPILRMLGKDGISYATYNQVASQQTIRVVPIDGLTPEADSYPYQRPLFYVYSYPPSPQVEAFLGYASSGIGKQVIQDSQLQTELPADISNQSSSAVASKPSSQSSFQPSSQSSTKPQSSTQTTTKSPPVTKPQSSTQSTSTSTSTSTTKQNSNSNQSAATATISPNPTTTTVNPFLKKEIRGIYISRYQITNRANEQTIRDWVRYYKSQGFNTIIHGVWGNGCTMYNSQVLQDKLKFNHCPNLFQAQWLNWLIDEAHKQGMEVHAYFEKGIKIDHNSQIFQLAHQKGWLVEGIDKTYQGINHYVLDVSNPEVVALFTDIIREFAQKYPQIDAIQWDDYLGYHSELQTTNLDYTASLTKFVQGMVKAVKEVNPQINFDICHHNPYWAKRYFASDWENWNIDRVFIQAYNEKNFQAEVNYAQNYQGIAITDKQLHRLPEIIKNDKLKSILVFPLSGNPQQTASRVNQLL